MPAQTPTSELTARITGTAVWLLGAAVGVFAYATRDDEGFDSLGNALTIVLLLGPALLLSVVTLVCLVLRLRQGTPPPVLTWLLAGPPAAVGVLFVLLQLTRAFR